MSDEPAGVSTKIRLVCATRHNQETFFSQSLLGRSLPMLRKIEPIELMLFVENKLGLPSVYNKAIEQSRDNPAVLVFIHDDVLIPDLFIASRIREGLGRFDLIGVAGNRRRVERQPAWLFKDIKLTWDHPHLSGAIAHGSSIPPRNISFYGNAGVEVKLLDGVLLAIDSRKLIERHLRFDERFRFHFYDMDFCRAAERERMRMGTWPMTLIHGSGGKFGGEQWRLAYDDYIRKWGN